MSGHPPEVICPWVPMIPSDPLMRSVGTREWDHRACHSVVVMLHLDRSELETE